MKEEEINRIPLRRRAWDYEEQQSIAQATLGRTEQKRESQMEGMEKMNTGKS